MAISVQTFMHLVFGRSMLQNSKAEEPLPQLSLTPPRPYSGRISPISVVQSSFLRERFFCGFSSAKRADSYCVFTAESAMLIASNRFARQLRPWLPHDHG
jgi:hypothetical protein